jgi:hypothetical protein
MSTIRINPYQKDHLESLYSKFGENPFEWAEAKSLIHKGMFRVFCDNGFIVKSGLVTRRTITSGGKYSYSTITHWKMDTDYVKRFIYGEKIIRKKRS